MRAIDLACIMLGVPTFSILKASAKRMKWVWMVLLVFAVFVVVFYLATLIQACCFYKEV